MPFVVGTDSGLGVAPMVITKIDMWGGETGTQTSSLQMVLARKEACYAFNGFL